MPNEVFLDHFKYFKCSGDDNRIQNVRMGTLGTIFVTFSQIISQYSIISTELSGRHTGAKKLTFFFISVISHRQTNSPKFIIQHLLMLKDGFFFCSFFLDLFFQKKVDPFVSTVHLPHPFKNDLNKVVVFTEVSICF